MPTVTVKDFGKITFPDSMSQDEIKAALDKRFSTAPDKAEYNSLMQGARQVGQGATFGFSDELQSGLIALSDMATSGDNFNDAYDRSQKDLAAKRQAFGEDTPVLAPLLEIAGGRTTGGAGAGRVLGSQAIRNAPALARGAAMTGTGAAEGALYGAGTADAGERLQGAAEGGAYGALGGVVAAPIANTIGRVGGSLVNRGAKMAQSSPKNDALRVIRDTAEAVGLTPEEAARRMKQLGPDATIADVDEGMRLVARAGSNRLGTMKDKATDLLDKRNRASGQRLLSTIEATAGSSKSFGDTQKKIIQRRRDQAAPIYDAARERGIEMAPEIQQIVRNTHIQQQANKFARLQGKPPIRPPMKTIIGPTGKPRQVPDPNATIFDNMTPQDRYDYLKFAKEGIADMEGKAMRAGEGNRARILRRQKKELLEAMGDQNPEYLQANAIFAGDSALEEALVTGRKLMSPSTDFDEVADMFKSLSPSEQEMFRLGAVKSVADKLDSLGANRDVNAVIGTGAPAAVRRKIDLVLGDDAPEFLRRAGIEEEFAKTRRSITGNSTTAQQQQIGEALDEMIDPGMFADLANSNKSNIVGKVINVLTARKPTPEILDQLGTIMLKQGYTGRQIKNIFAGSGVRRALGDDYDRIVAPYVSGSTPLVSEIIRSKE